MTRCENTICTTENGKAEVHKVLLRQEFDHGLVEWCTACIEDDFDMVLVDVGLVDEGVRCIDDAEARAQVFAAQLVDALQDAGADLGLVEMAERVQGEVSDL